jgi:hypothetical protein
MTMIKYPTFKYITAIIFSTNIEDFHRFFLLGSPCESLLLGFYRPLL